VARMVSVPFPCRELPPDFSGHQRRAFRVEYHGRPSSGAADTGAVHTTGCKGAETQERASVRSPAMRWLPPFANVVCEWSVRVGEGVGLTRRAEEGVGAQRACVCGRGQGSAGRQTRFSLSPLLSSFLPLNSEPFPHS